MNKKDKYDLRHSFSIRLTPQTRKLLEKLAREQRRSLCSMIQSILEGYLINQK